MTYIMDELVEDEIHYLDIGLGEEREFFTYLLDSLSLSYIDDWDTTYKIAGFSVFRHFDRMIYGRATYDFLAFLGDVGGLEGILILFGGAVISYYTGFATTVFMMPYLFYYRQFAQPEEIQRYENLMQKV
jgi:hypothetical protein